MIFCLRRLVTLALKRGKSIVEKKIAINRYENFLCRKYFCALRNNLTTLFKVYVNFNKSVLFWKLVRQKAVIRKFCEFRKVSQKKREMLHIARKKFMLNMQKLACIQFLDQYSTTIRYKFTKEKVFSRKFIQASRKFIANIRNNRYLKNEMSLIAPCDKLDASLNSKPLNIHSTALSTLNCHPSEYHSIENPSFLLRAKPRNNLEQLCSDICVVVLPRLLSKTAIQRSDHAISAIEYL
jgi:hypothetical protein